jgi:cytochrome c-type biogenesis protein CcmF
VGAPFFNLVNIPIFLALLFLMGVGPLIAWRRASARELKRNFLKPVLAGVVVAAIMRGWAWGMRWCLPPWPSWSSSRHHLPRSLSRGADAAAQRRRLGAATFGLLLRQNRRYGGFIVHLGILVIALGVAGSQAVVGTDGGHPAEGSDRRPRRLHVRFDGLEATEESNHAKVTGAFT